jgi:hypothetical protein
LFTEQDNEILCVPSSSISQSSLWRANKGEWRKRISVTPIFVEYAAEATINAEKNEFVGTSNIAGIRYC